jgi:hypothetical protein
LSETNLCFTQNVSFQNAFKTLALLETPWSKRCQNVMSLTCDMWQRRSMPFALHTALSWPCLQTLHHFQIRSACLTPGGVFGGDGCVRCGLTAAAAAAAAKVEQQQQQPGPPLVMYRVLHAAI